MEVVVDKAAFRLEVGLVNGQPVLCVVGKVGGAAGQIQTRKISRNHLGILRVLVRIRETTSRKRGVDAFTSGTRHSLFAGLVVETVAGLAQEGVRGSGDLNGLRGRLRELICVLRRLFTKLGMPGKMVIHSRLVHGYLLCRSASDCKGECADQLWVPKSA